MKIGQNVWQSGDYMYCIFIHTLCIHTCTCVYVIFNDVSFSCNVVIHCKCNVHVHVYMYIYASRKVMKIGILKVGGFIINVHVLQQTSV